MLINQVVVYPSADTLDYLNAVFETCPFSVDLSSLHVVMNESWEPYDELNPNNTYAAWCVEFDCWYNDAVETSSLIMTLYSFQLNRRMMELRLQSPAVFHPLPMAFATVLETMPPINRRYRNFISSVSDILYNSDTPLIFTGEEQFMTDIEGKPYAEYYKAQLH